MKHISLLALLCSISSSNIFSSEKNSIQQQIATNNYQNEKESVLNWRATLRTAKEPAYDIDVIKDLQKKHQLEIDLYEQKIIALQSHLEAKDQQIKQLISNK